MSEDVVVIGGGFAGLVAAERLAQAGHRVAIYERMPSMGRKFLVAGRSGLNLTKSEPLDSFVEKYRENGLAIKAAIRAFPPDDFRKWADGLGAETFVGTSGRVFPKGMKATPLLRALLKRLRALNVRFVLRHRWLGWEGSALVFEDEQTQRVIVKPKTVLLALGGASWPQLGSDAAWVDTLKKKGVAISALRPANCGFVTGWSDVFKARYSGHPIKPIQATFGEQSMQGEAMVTGDGLEGGVLYALGAALRDEIDRKGEAVLTLDLRRGLSQDELVSRILKSGSSLSFANRLKRIGGFSPASIGLLMEHKRNDPNCPMDAQALAALIKTFPVRLTATTSLDRAISTAGGIKAEAVDETFKLLSLPNVYAVGEMLDWEAPTGGYLLQGCYSTACVAAEGIKLILKMLNAGAPVVPSGDERQAAGDP